MTEQQAPPPMFAQAPKPAAIPPSDAKPATGAERVAALKTDKPTVAPQNRVALAIGGLVLVALIVALAGTSPMAALIVGAVVVGLLVIWLLVRPLIAALALRRLTGGSRQRVSQAGQQHPARQPQAPRGGWMPTRRPGGGGSPGGGSRPRGSGAPTGGGRPPRGSGQPSDRRRMSDRLPGGDQRRAARQEAASRPLGPGRTPAAPKSPNGRTPAGPKPPGPGRPPAAPKPPRRRTNGGQPEPSTSKPGGGGGPSSGPSGSKPSRRQRRRDSANGGGHPSGGGSKWTDGGPSGNGPKSSKNKPPDPSKQSRRDWWFGPNRPADGPYPGKPDKKKDKPDPASGPKPADPKSPPSPEAKPPGGTSPETADSDQPKRRQWWKRKKADAAPVAESAGTGTANDPPRTRNEGDAGPPMEPPLTPVGEAARKGWEAERARRNTGSAEGPAPQSQPRRTKADDAALANDIRAAAGLPREATPAPVSRPARPARHPRQESSAAEGFAEDWRPPASERPRLMEAHPTASSAETAAMAEMDWPTDSARNERNSTVSGSANGRGPAVDGSANDATKRAMHEAIGDAAAKSSAFHSAEASKARAVGDDITNANDGTMTSGAHAAYAEAARREQVAANRGAIAAANHAQSAG